MNNFDFLDKYFKDDYPIVYEQIIAWCTEAKFLNRTFGVKCGPFWSIVEFVFDKHKVELRFFKKGRMRAELYEGILSKYQLKKTKTIATHSDPAGLVMKTNEEFISNVSSWMQ